MARVIPNKGYGGIYGKEAAGKSSNNVRNQRASNAANDFAAAEKSASEAAPKVTDNTTSSSTDVAENGAAGQAPKYGGGAGAVGSAAAMAAKTTPMGKLANMFRGKGGTSSGGSKKPLFAIGGTTAIIGVFMFGMSSLLPMHLIENFSDLRNSMSTQSDIRGNRLIRHLFNSKNDAESLFNKRNKMSDRRVNQLNQRMDAQGMRFTAEGDQMVLKVASTSDVKADGSINWDGVGDVVRTEADFKLRWSSDATFRNTFNKGARVMTGKNANWFNSNLAGYLGKNSITRNLFSRFVAENGDSAVAQARARAVDQAQKATKADVNNTAVENKAGQDGQPDTNTRGDTSSARQSSFQANKTRIVGEIKAKAQGLLKGALVAVALVAPCAVMLAVSAVSAIYAAQQAMEGLAVVAAWFEAGQKVQAGDGDDSYHAFGDMLNTATPTTVMDDNGIEQELHDGAKMTATESGGLQQVLLGAAVSGTDQSALKYNMDKAFSHASTSIAMLQGCAAFLATAAIAGAAMFIVQVIVAATTFGIGAVIWEVVEEVAGAVIAPLLVGALTSTVAPMIAGLLLKEIATEVGGEDFGNLVASMGARYFAGGHQANGGVGMTYDAALFSYREHQNVLARQAEQDRAERSPFDVTSKNTFLGSIAFQFSAYGASSGSFLGKVSGFGSVISNNRPNIFTPVSAITELEFRETVAVSATGDNQCPMLATINAIGDQFCNPIRGNDLTTADENPEEVFWKVAYTCTENAEGSSIGRCSFKGERRNVSTAEEFHAARDRGDPWARCYTTINGDDYVWGTSRCNGNGYQAYVFELDSDGFEQINPKSDLAKMVNYGVERNSDLGVLDANIISELADNGAPSWLGYVPIVGDVMDAFSAASQADEDNIRWANGSNICAGCNPIEWDGTYKYLSQYISDQSLYVGMGGMTENPVMAYIEKEIAPFRDMTYEGRLAAVMGMPKAFVVNTLAFAKDIYDAPQSVDALIASAPNIYSTYYLGIDGNEFYIPAEDETCRIFDSMRACTQIAGTELRRRFNAEAVA